MLTLHRRGWNVLDSLGEYLCDVGKTPIPETHQLHDLQWSVGSGLNSEMRR
jgi:hypothetical protein